MTVVFNVHFHPNDCSSLDRLLPPNFRKQHALEQLTRNSLVAITPATRICRIQNSERSFDKKDVFCIYWLNIQSNLIGADVLNPTDSGLTGKMQKPRRSSLTGEVDTRPIHEQQRERDLGQRGLNCRYKAMAALTAFANLGFRKTSMALLAECIGTSRQTLYNRFAGKEHILVWAVSTLSESLRNEATIILAKDDTDILSQLTDALYAWLGPFVALLRNGTHGEEFLGLRSNSQSGLDTTRDPFHNIKGAITDYLIRRNVCADKKDAKDKALALVLIAKGLMYTSVSQRAFRRDMRAAIRGVGMQTKEPNQHR